MARYRHVDLSPRLLPVDLEVQLVPGTFAHAAHHLVDDLNPSAFDAYAICPASKQLYRNSGDCHVDGYTDIKFRAPASACRDCSLRTQYLRKSDTTRSHQMVALTRNAKVTPIQRIPERIDSPTGRAQDGRRCSAICLTTSA